MSTQQRKSENPRERAAQNAPYTEGSILRHFVDISVKGVLALLALYAAAFADTVFVSWLKDAHSTAALGLASSVGFLFLALTLGLAIAAGARVGNFTGQGKIERARSITAAALWIAMLMGVGFLIFMWLGAELILAIMGGQGRTQELGATYLRITGIGFPFLACMAVFMMVLRGYGKPREAMVLALTLTGMNVVLDPILIFGLRMGLAGAAVATFTAYFVSFLLGLYYYSHLFGTGGKVWHVPFKPDDWRADTKELLSKAFHISVGRLADPVITAYMLAVAARFGPDMAAAMTVVRGVSMFTFRIFSLTDAAMPIISQNYGACIMKRVRQTFKTGLGVVAACTLLVWLVLAMLSPKLPEFFTLTGQSAQFVELFSRIGAVAWIFLALQFMAHGAFNGLERPWLTRNYSWGRAIFGTILLVEIATRIDHLGAFGILWGVVIGWTIIGLLAVWHAWRIIR